MESSNKVPVVVDEELTLIREAIAALGEQSPKYSVVDQCGDGESAFRLISTKRSDVAPNPRRQHSEAVSGTSMTSP